MRGISERLEPQVDKHIYYSSKAIETVRLTMRKQSQPSVVFAVDVVVVGES